MGYVFLSNRIDKNTYPISGKGPYLLETVPKTNTGEQVE